MDKYTKTLFTMFRVLIGVFYTLIGVALIGISFWISNFSDVASMIFLPALLGGGCIINYGIGYGFLGDNYKATNIVHDGQTMFTPVKTPEFLKRRKIVTFIGFVAYILLAIYYIVRTILVCVFMNYLQKVDFNTNIVALIIFAIISLILAFVFFMIYKKTKHIDLKEE